MGGLRSVEERKGNEKGHDDGVLQLEVIFFLWFLLMEHFEFEETMFDSWAAKCQQ